MFGDWNVAPLTCFCFWGVCISFYVKNVCVCVLIYIDSLQCVILKIECKILDYWIGNGKGFGNDCLLIGDVDLFVLYFVPFYVNANLGIAYGARNLGTLMLCLLEMHIWILIWKFRSTLNCLSNDFCLITAHAPPGGSWIHDLILHLNLTRGGSIWAKLIGRSLAFLCVVCFTDSLSSYYTLMFNVGPLSWIMWLFLSSVGSLFSVEMVTGNRCSGNDCYSSVLISHSSPCN